VAEDEYSNWLLNRNLKKISFLRYLLQMTLWFRNIKKTKA